MPLPLPNLDTRRWSDLVAEGQALIPRYAPEWTDHNVHDPGIMLMELLAWLVEQEIYRANRVPERHRRKFLALAGYPPAPPAAARLALTFTLDNGSGSQQLPAGLTVAAHTAKGQTLRFRTDAELNVVPASIAAVQVFDGTEFLNQTRLWRDGLPFPLLGPDPQSDGEQPPEAQPALYVGLDRSLSQNTSFSLWFWLYEGSDSDAKRERLRQEAEDSVESCPPPTADRLATRTVWEFFSAGHWQTLDAEAGEVSDHTRNFTFDGPLHVRLPADMEATTVGANGAAESYFYLRCRLVDGRPDAAPELFGMALNTVAARQISPVRGAYTIAAGAQPEAGMEPQPGARQKLHLVFGENNVITELAAGPDVTGPEVFVLDYQAPTASSSGSLSATLALIGRGTCLPEQQLTLPGAPIAGGQVKIWTVSAGRMERWAQEPDFDASKRTQAHFTLDATGGTITFGNGERGRVLPAGAAVLAQYDQTAAATGNVLAGSAWTLLGADDALNAALPGLDLAALDGALQEISNLRAAVGGAGEESLLHAAGRAAEALWAHERLVELCPQAACATLDQIQRAKVLSRAAPARAVTLLDYERLALDTPGVRISRARAWAGIDPGLPCFSAPGTVTVVILPYLPQGRPQPTESTLAAVHRYLDRRRTVGTRLLVVGPDYLPVRVLATVRARPGADIDRVQADIFSALNTFLDPLQGGPAGRGWPFGRDVYRAEILQVIDGIAGVDHVLSLELVGGEGEAQCGNLCLGPTFLPAPTAHEIEVVTA